MGDAPSIQRVAALTSGYDTPSARFRIRQHLPLLYEAGIDVQEYIPAIDKNAPVPLLQTRLKMRKRQMLPAYLLWQGVKLATRAPGMLGAARADMLWLQRELLPGFLSLEPMLLQGICRGRPSVLDVDDAIWMMGPNGRKAVPWIARHVDVVVAGNRYLAEYFAPHSQDVRVIPTAVDTERFRPPEGQEPARKERGFVLGWSGLSANYRYLYAIEEALHRFLSDYPDVRLRLVAERPPTFTTIPPERVEYVPWSPEREAGALRDIDAGLMPLFDDEWTRGKCSFKMLQYMACAVPVVVSPIGMNAEVLALGDVGYGARTPDEWYNALESLRADRARSTAQGQNGLRVVRKYFSRTVIAARLADLFRELAPPGND
jgi:glycosyltransferase involved in cell wall biosynthesis